MSEHYKITFFSITSTNTPQNKSNSPRFFKKSCLHSTQNSTPTTLFKETALKLFTIQKKELPFHRPNTTKFISTYHLHSTHPPSTGCRVHLSKSRPNDRFGLNGPHIRFLQEHEKSRCVCIGFYIRGTTYLLYVAPFRSLRDYMALTFF